MPFEYASARKAAEGTLFVSQGDDRVEAGSFKSGPHAEEEADADGDHKRGDY
jgi:hypothetical protein